ncbi:T9SS C-terminal target domain-containing protein [Chryseobacterium formosus]|uniref:T9SS C-terminal target domain-containing protein n=1 Tax=Chryseobacterium formosus TaxID=1537363 RepID=A0ABT3XXR8_9FLAO|nr:T9SS C-terminal target domain-containing protein [Chryseobacterium formosus]MCX8526453.1 T9SS C-terminal target domain-containing protein [Chryseobacterium formosus]
MNKILIHIAFLLIFGVINTSIRAQITGTPHLNFKPITARYGGSDNDYLFSLDATPDGGYIYGGYSSSASANNGDQLISNTKGNIDYWLVKTDMMGNIQWQKRFGGAGDDYLYKALPTSDSGYILIGRSASESANTGDQNNIAGKGGIDYWVVKIDSAGVIQWQKRFGGSDDDLINGSASIIQTTDGGYFLGGYSVAASAATGDQSGSVGYGGYDYWVLKISSSGTIQWQKRYGGSGDDYLYSIKQTNDGGYILGGNSLVASNGIQMGLASHGMIDYWIIKTDSTGNISWQRNYGSNEDDNMYDIQQTNDGGYIIAGHSSAGLILTGDQQNINPTSGSGIVDFWIIKITTTGAIQWQKRYGGSGIDYCYSIKQTADTGFIVGGFSDDNSANTGDQSGSFGFGGNDFWVIKTDNNGIVQWQKRFGGASDDFLYSITENPDSFILGGFSAQNSYNSGTQSGINSKGNFDFWAIKVNKDGQVGMLRY